MELGWESRSMAISAPFEVFEPRTGHTPVVVEVPHAGLFMDPESMAHCVAPVMSLAADADLYVDELVADLFEEGATIIASRWSRYVVDLNRAPDDVDGRSVRGATASSCPHGLLWRETRSGCQALRQPVEPQELQRRLDCFYKPYHGALDEVVEHRCQRFGTVVVLSMHSMPSEGVDADVVIGTLGRSTASDRLVDGLEKAVRAFGLRVVHDVPYAGGATTARLGKPQAGMHAMQVEVARRLYMNERTFCRYPEGFSMVRSLCRTMVATMGRAAVG